MKMTGYSSLFRGEKEIKCELKARLFDAEIEFPPFDFLQLSDGQNALLDFKALNACLLSGLQ